jgi:predicted RNA methylase
VLNRYSMRSQYYNIRNNIYLVKRKKRKNLKIDEFISNLPSEVISGQDITIADSVFRNLFKFANLSSQDVFYYIGFGNNNKSLEIAKEEFMARKVIGIDDNEKFVTNAKNQIKVSHGIEILKTSIESLNLSEASILFFWFNDLILIDKLKQKIEKEMKMGSRIVTILSPPGLMLPSKVDYPFIMCKKPFSYASDLKQQIKAIYGNSCIDFTASWLLSEKYIKKLGTPTQYSRFINILLSMTIWINAWNNGVACEKEIPPPVESYIGILRTFFNIDLTEMLKK